IAVVGEERPDFRTIRAFRKQPLEGVKEVCVQVVRLAGEAGLVKLGNVSTDGTKLQGNASRHKAMSLRGYNEGSGASARGDCGLGDAGLPAGRGGRGRLGQSSRRCTARRAGAT